MVSEIHGTNEPVKFLESLVTLIANNGDSLQVGFEISPDEMNRFIKKPTTQNILKSDFFSNPSGDGRASLAWYNAICNLNKNKRVSLFFFNNNNSQVGDADSIMYINIKNRFKEKPNWKIVTISGNMHSRKYGDKQKKTIYTYLKEDAELNLIDNICSINHEFESGETLWNTFDKTPIGYIKLPYQNYFVIYSDSLNQPFNAVYFTKKLTKSDSAISTR